MDKGYVKLYRSIDEWEYRQDIKTFSVWMRLLTLANHAQKEWRGVFVGIGECITSVEHLSNFCGVSIQSVRTALDKLEKSKCIVREGTNRYTKISICNYGFYQNIEDMDVDELNKDEQTLQGFIFYRSYKEALEELDEKDKLEMYGAICEYALDGILPNFTGCKKALFSLIKPILDSNARKYRNKVNNKKNSDNNINLKISVVSDKE